MENEMSLEQLLKLEANPHYTLSEKQKAVLAQYKAKQFKHNPTFAKHQTTLEEEPDNGKSDSN